MILFSGCSSKKVFEPENVADDWEKYGTLSDDIQGVASDVAILENSRVLSKTGLLNIEIKEPYQLIAKSDEWIISATIDGKVRLQSIKDAGVVKNFDVKKTVATANVNKNLLAILLASDEMLLMDIESGKLLMQEQGSAPLAVDARIVKPYFMNGLVVFSTLDGKVVIINTELKKKLRTIIVSSEENFNNIISFNIVDNKIIALTGNKILSLSQKEIREKYETRNLVYDDKTVYIATKDGRVISLTPNLQEIAKLKFPFAHFLGMIMHNDKLFILEKEGYLIVADKDLQKYSIHEVDVNEGYVFVGDTKFNIADEFISVE